MAKITRRQLADMIGVKEGTLRKYEREFSAWLVSAPGQKGKPAAKTYEEEDIRTLYVIHQLRQANVSYQDMKAFALDEALESGQFEVMPDATERATEREEQQSTALVPVEQYAIVVGQLQATEREMERVLEERDKAQEALREAEKSAAAAAATSEERDRLLERLERMEGKLDSVQEELQSERMKGWWDKLRRR